MRTRDLMRVSMRGERDEKNASSASLCATRRVNLISRGDRRRGRHERGGIRMARLIRLSVGSASGTAGGRLGIEIALADGVRVHNRSGVDVNALAQLLTLLRRR